MSKGSFGRWARRLLAGRGRFWPMLFLAGSGGCALGAGGLVAAAAPAAAATVAAPVGPAGQTGLVRIPTTDIAPEGTLAVTFTALGNRNEAGVVYGVADWLEVGVASEDGPGGAAQLLPMLKGRLVAEDPHGPGLAAGLQGGDLFAVISQGLPGGWRLYGGVGSGRLDGFFAGLAVELSPEEVTGVDSSWPKAQASADWLGGHWTLGLTVHWQVGSAVQVALEDLQAARVTAGFRTRL